MRRKGETTTFQERLEIVEKSEAGCKAPEIAAMLGCSIPTVRKWRRQYAKAGLSGLLPKRGRPATGALGSKSTLLRDTIRQVRQQHPGWGPISILLELQRQKWPRAEMPGRSRVAAFLKQEGFTRRYQKHSSLPQPEPEATIPHQLWQVDAQGVVEVDGVGKVSPINIIDMVSRLKVESYPCVGTTKPGADDYRLALRRAFINYGRPGCISFDHDAALFQNTHPSPFPMPVHLWLIGLGIEVVFIHKPPPAEHAVIERNHQTIEAQTLQGMSYQSQNQIWKAMDERRAVLNEQFPSRSLNGQAPLVAFPQAKQSGRSYSPQEEEALLSLNRVFNYLAQGRWFRRTGNNGCLTIGRQLYYLHHRAKECEVTITFDAEKASFTFQPAGWEETFCHEARGLTKADLMGDLANLLKLPPYQLSLPFTRADRRWMELAGSLENSKNRSDNR